MRHLLPTLMLLGLAAAPAAGEVREFRGGDLDGMRFEIAADAVGGEVTLIPAVPNAATDIAAAATVDALIEAFRLKSEPAFQPVVKQGAALYVSDGECRVPSQVNNMPACEPQRFDELSFGADCVASRPYWLAEDWVRVEWTCGGKLSYLGWFILSGNKIISGEVRQALPPVFMGTHG